MGKLYIVGIGPGSPEQMTAAARSALEQADLICGYTLYIGQIRPLYPEKEYYATGMTGEVARCRECLRQAAERPCVALVCSGDAGVYGMAGLVLELAEGMPDVDIEVVPGVTAALSGAALLGAPLGHDFCVISLSDRLTDWSLIERRLRCAAEGDFALCLYNPSSHQRTDTLQRACDVLLEQKSPRTVCGIARNIGREDQSIRILSLGQLRDTQTDMFSTVFVGSSATRRIGETIVTPRGYRA